MPLISSLVLWLPYARLAGFLYDDWAFVAKYTFNLAPVVSFRLGHVLWAPLSVRLMGLHAHWYYATTELVFALSATAVFVVLVSLRLPILASLTASVLYVVYPGADAARLWWTATENSLAICLVLTSVVVGVKWSEGRGWSVQWLLASLALLVTGVLIYEEAGVLILLPLAALPMSAGGRRRALVKTAFDFSAVAICFSLTLMANAATGIQTVRPVDQFPSRTLTLVVDGFQAVFVHIFAGASDVGIRGILIMVVGTLVGTAALVIRARVGRRDGPAWTRSAMVSGLLFVAVFAAWLPLVPANDYYLPSLLGIGNRVNSSASVFLCAGLGTAFFSIATLVSRARLRVMGSGVAAAFLSLTASAFIVASVADANFYVQAAQQRQRLLQIVTKAVPKPAHGDLIVLSDYNAFWGPNWVPVLAASWDLDGAVKILYNDPSLVGTPLFSSFSCVASGIQVAPHAILLRPGRMNSGTGVVGYSRVDLIDASTGVREPIGSAADCARIIATQHVRLYP